MPVDDGQLSLHDTDLSVAKIAAAAPAPAESRLERGLRWFARVELPLGLALVAAGFAAIGLGWLDASGTADVRVQMQDLISGGVGGLALVIVGGFLLIAQLAERAARRSEQKLDRVTAALLAMAGSVAPSLVDEPSDEVVASHASYHVASCDLTTGRRRLRKMSKANAVAEGLEPCSVCIHP
ncbi:MAG TPA: hypothetical protein VFA83_22425 [Acidimicrobiales bacterium]|nr:hypothetical protein [Acidimicrobiales bacterium]